MPFDPGLIAWRAGKAPDIVVPTAGGGTRAVSPSYRPSGAGALPGGLGFGGTPAVSNILPIVPVVTATATSLGLPAILAGLLGAGAGYGLSQLGNGNGQTMIGPVPLGGPGLKEPSADMIAKEWKIRFDCKEGDFNVQYYQLINGRMCSYNQRTGQWKTWIPKKMVVIGKKLPSHQMLVRLRSYLKKHSDDAVTILKITNPGKLRQYQRVATGYKVQRKYR